MMVDSGAMCSKRYPGQCQDANLDASKADEELHFRNIFKLGAEPHEHNSVERPAGKLNTRCSDTQARGWLGEGANRGESLRGKSTRDLVNFVRLRHLLADPFSLLPPIHTLTQPHTNHTHGKGQSGDNQ